MLKKLKNGSTLTDLFKDLASDFPEFCRQVYDPDKGWSSDQAMVILNHKLVLESEFSRIKLNDNDEISLSPVLVGG